MKKIQYSPDSLEKLHKIKQDIIGRYGAEKAKCVILYVQHNYAFYRIEGDVVWIIDIFNERKDFMWKLFGIQTTTQESEDYWGE